MTSATNPDELAKYIQYRLGMLGEENAHHRFEELSFRVAKATVASHLLPPSGPVSAGGDQGRDFESFRIEGVGGNVTRVFASTVSAADTIVFACTTQRGSDADLARKVKHDLATAVAREPRPTVLYFYASSVTLAPASRHDLQDWARQEHGVRLEVIDQRAISELLSDGPNRWLAQHYLAVPAEMLRADERGPELPVWYEDARRRFGNPAERSLTTHAELDLVSRCARHAWETPGLERDDGLWLDLLSDLWGAPEAFQTEHGLRAFYEAFVYLVRGRERCGLEAHVQAYVTGLVAADDLGLVRDAQCFASYLVGGVARGHVDIDRATARAQFGVLVAWIEAKIERPPGPMVLSDLLVARGCVVFSEAALGLDPPTDEALVAFATETLEWWTRALDVGERLLSFPLLHLGELLANIAPGLVDSPDYDAFVTRLDGACEQRHASQSIAATMRDRAVGFFKAERFLDALSPMLAARRHWHNGDRIRGSLLASMLAAQCLQRLGLIWAAKRILYDVVAVCNRTGDKSHAGVLTDAVFQLAEVEYVAGDWASAVHTYRLALRLHVEYTPDPWNFGKHTRLHQGAFYLVNILVAGDIVAPGFRAWGAAVVEGWDLADHLDRFSIGVRQTWEGVGLLDRKLGASCPLHGPPLADLVSMRGARWQALGLKWEVTWANDYELESAGIEFTALLQFIQAGLAKRYLHLLPTSVLVELVPYRDGQPPVRPKPGSGVAKFEIGLPVSESKDDPTRDLRSVALFAATMIIESVSVDADFRDQLPKLVGNMISDGVFVGACVIEGRLQVSPPESWLDAPRPFQVVTEAFDCAQLPWRPGTSPSFTQEEADEKLRRRYEGGFRTARPVLVAHGHRSELRKLVRDLRAEGWRDWQIASAFAPAVVSDHANDLVRRGLSQETARKAMEEGMRRARTGDYRSPPWTQSLAKSIRFCVQTSLIYGLQAWDLEVKYPTPDMDAIRRFLDERFLHFVDLPPGEREAFPWEAPR